MVRDHLDRTAGVVDAAGWCRRLSIQSHTAREGHLTGFLGHQRTTHMSPARKSRHKGWLKAQTAARRRRDEVNGIWRRSGRVPCSSRSDWEADVGVEGTRTDAVFAQRAGVCAVSRSKFALVEIGVEPRRVSAVESCSWLADYVSIYPERWFQGVEKAASWSAPLRRARGPKSLGASTSSPRASRTAAIVKARQDTRRGSAYRSTVVPFEPF